MIRTGLQKVPWHWVVLLCMTTGIRGLSDVAINGAPMQRLLKQFNVTDPLHLQLIAAVGIVLAAVIAPYVSWKSDRIWTRFGRRKPFMLVGFGALVLLMLATPLAPGVFILLAIIFLANAANDMGYDGPFAPLLYEVVPSPQRGRAAAIKKGMQQTFGLGSNFFLLAQWDHTYTLPLPGPGDLHITGAHVMYFVTGGFLLIAWLNIAFNVKETTPKEPLPPERFNPIKFVADLFSSRQWIMIYCLQFCAVALTAGLGGYMTTALIVDQFGYDMKEFARKIAVPNMILNLLVVIPVAFFLADRFNRRLLFRAGLWLSTLHALAMWGMVQWLGVPSIPVWIAMTFVGQLVDQVAAIALEPLVFDLVPPDKMGTANSGFLIVSRVLILIIMPMVGFFARQYSFWRFGRHDDPTQQQYDYSGGFLVVFVMGLLACGVYAYFESQWRKGNIVAYGKQKLAPAPAPELAPAPAPTPVPNKV